MAFCQYDGHEDALISLRDITGEKLVKVTEAIRRLRKEGFDVFINLYNFKRVEKEKNSIITNRDLRFEKKLS